LFQPGAGLTHLPMYEPEASKLRRELETKHNLSLLSRPVQCCSRIGEFLC
jgi:hypothetical protein